MYKARRSKYFVIRCAGKVNCITKKYAHARLVYLDTTEHAAEDDVEFVKIPITAFCEDNSIPKTEVAEGLCFYMYIQHKGNKKKLILEKIKLRPRTKTFNLGVKRRMKMFCRVLHGDNWKEVWKTWDIANRKDNFY